MDTKEIIQKNINSRLTSCATQIEGGAVQDIIGSVSYELANIVDTRIDVILDNAFVSTCDEDYLKIRGEELGIIKKESETFEEYRLRILEYMKDNAVNSNVADYIKWAKSIDGVNRVIVHDAFKAGAGNVNVYISAIHNEVVSVDLINKVKEKIEKERIINANVKVQALSYYPIDISASVLPIDGFSIEHIKQEFEQKLNEYFKNPSNVVSYLYVSNILFDTGCVSDVSNFLINDSEKTVILDELQVPKINSINLFNMEDGEE